MGDAIYSFPVASDGVGGPDQDDFDLTFNFPEGTDNPLHSHGLDGDARVRGAVDLPLWSDMGGEKTTQRACVKLWMVTSEHSGFFRSKTRGKKQS